MERFIVDRIEGSIAVLEEDDGGFRDVPVSELPAGLRRGDCLELEAGSWRVDAARTKERLERLRALRKGLMR